MAMEQKKAVNLGGGEATASPAHCQTSEGPHLSCSMISCCPAVREVRMKTMKSTSWQPTHAKDRPCRTACKAIFSASRTDSLQLTLVGRRFENICVDFLMFWNRLFVFMKLVCMLSFFAYFCPFHVAFQFTFIFPIAF